MSDIQTLRLADYARPSVNTDFVSLNFDIHEDHTIATSKVTYYRDSQNGGNDFTELVLNAENPNPKGTPYIKSVKVDGWELSPEGYSYDEKTNELRIPFNLVDDEMEVEIETYLEPQHNAALTGLYQSDSVITTQCESQGFRRITPFLDRPDVMAIYDVRVEADKAAFPTLMANGNKTGEGDLAGGRHFATYNDPWPKPAYLFCTANGNLDVVEDVFVTMSGRDVNVRVFTEPGESEKGKHALEALKQSMKWDEDVFGCEYDLDDYNVVSVAKFTFGAMENKGLNIFRDSLVLATPDIATDGNYQSITDVIGHEYFHNYSGNRVTLANWFNISLKEGLTVMREQMFTAFTTSDSWERISAVRTLRAAQFPSDDGPLAHPVMPPEAASVENLYTGTIYQKGSEVLRMMKVMMGEEKFVEGVKDYFKTYDGQAVTIDEFKASMEKVSGLDFSGQFDLWYTQAGRPRIGAKGVYDAVSRTYTLTLEQSFIESQQSNKPMMIPIEMALVDDQGQDMEAVYDNKATAQHLLLLTKPKQTFVFENVAQEPAFHSLLRGFSAPVTLDSGLSDEQLFKQMTDDSDGFNRWDAGQKLALAELTRLYKEADKTGAMPAVDARFIEAMRTLWSQESEDAALKAETFSMPGIKELEAALGKVSPRTLYGVRKHLSATLATELRAEMKAVFSQNGTSEPYRFEYAETGRRALRNSAMAWLSLNSSLSLLHQLEHEYLAADNMTDRLAAMSALKNHDSQSRTAVFDDFYDRYKDDKLTIQKWFMLQGASDFDGVIDTIKDIMESDVFNWENPGHAQSLMRGFISNYGQFHHEDGRGYMFIADVVKKLDDINGTTASRFVEVLANWGNYSDDQAALMIKALESISEKADLTPQVREKLVKSLPKKDEGATDFSAPAPQ